MMDDGIRFRIHETFQTDKERIDSLQFKIQKLTIAKEDYYNRFLQAQNNANHYMAKSEALEKELRFLQVWKDKYIYESG